MRFFLVCLLFSLNTFAKDYITLSFWDEANLYKTARIQKVYEGDSNIKLAVRFLERRNIQHSFDDYGFIYIGDKVRFNDANIMHFWCLTVNGQDADPYAIAQDDSEISWHYIAIDRFFPLRTYSGTFCMSRHNQEN